MKMIRIASLLEFLTTRRDGTVRIVVLSTTFCLLFFFGASSAPAVDLIWGDLGTDQILRAPADGSGPVRAIVDRNDYPGETPESVSIYGIDVDEGFIYWADIAGTDRILRRALNGGGPATQLFDAREVRGIKVDNDYVYWASFRGNVYGEVLRGMADGSGSPQVLFHTGEYSSVGSGPWDVAVDNGFVYWSDQNAEMILRGLADGSGSPEVLFDVSDYPGSPDYALPRHLTIDDGFIYWADSHTDQILRGSTNGSGSATVVVDINDYPGSPSEISPRGLTVEGDIIYWTDSRTDQILMGAADGNGPVNVLYDIGDYPGLPDSISLNFITVVAEQLPGDYNDDGVVNAADYTLFRDSRGQTGAGLAADGDNSGTVDDLDQGVWAANFGNSLNGEASNHGVVPEPASLWLLLAGLASVAMVAGRRNRIRSTKGIHEIHNRITRTPNVSNTVRPAYRAEPPHSDPL